MYFNTSKNVCLQDGQTLTIRRPEHKDAKAMLNYLNVVGGESDNLLFGAGEMTLTQEQEIEYIDQMRKDENSLMLLGHMGSSIVSIAQITSNQRKRIAHNSEIAISVRKSHWRQGIGEAMLKELIAFANQHDRIKIVKLGVKAQNSGAIKLYQKLGFEKVGLHRDFFYIDGKYYDEILMDLHLDRREE